jgi:hypothetical protein
VLALVLLVLVLAPAGTSRAAANVQLGVNYLGQPVLYNTGADGTSGCSGPLVGVYGSSAIKSFIIQAGIDYCNTFADKSTAPDVEYSPGGDSCPGMDYAADNSDGNEIGASDVFYNSCAGTQARNPNKMNDYNGGQSGVTGIGVQPFIVIAQCPGVNDLQGGSPHAPVTDHQCTGSAPITSAGCPSVFNMNFASPNNLSVPSSQILWDNSLSDWSQVGGCAGLGPTLQQRSPGSGTRDTICFNIFGTNNDGLCANNSAAGTASTTGVELTDVCGNPYTTPATAPVDPAGTIGYATRSALVVNPLQPTGGLAPLSGCGIVQLNGVSGYNGTCDPATLSTGGTSSPSGTNSEDGAPTCNGDLDVVNGNVITWGYEHLFLNANSMNNTAAKDFLVFVSATEDLLLQQYGFVLNCQMTVSRSQDGGPYTALTTAASC